MIISTKELKQNTLNNNLIKALADAFNEAVLKESKLGYFEMYLDFTSVTNKECIGKDHFEQFIKYLQKNTKYKVQQGEKWNCLEVQWY